MIDQRDLQRRMGQTEVRQNGTGPYWLQVMECKPPYTTAAPIRQWQTGTPEAGPGPWAYGTCTWLPNGSLLIAVPGGVVDSNVTPAIHVEPNLFPPIPLGAVASQARKGHKVYQAPLARKGPPAPLGVAAR
jgi:hypothetical protein